jgi:multidrug efflux pump subunit AcrA (membrane-fusion protein)
MVLPYRAVLQSPSGPYVLVVDGDAIARRPIETGRVFFDFVTVLAGLGSDERVVIADAILVETERRLAAFGHEAAP